MKKPTSAQVKTRIYEYIRDNGPVTLREIADHLGLSIKRAEFYVTQLVREKYISYSIKVFYYVRKT